MTTPRRRLTTLALALAGGVALATLGPAPRQARAQDSPPTPRVSELAHRSGLIFRQTPIQSTLPPDPRRDSWYNTRWGDSPNERKHVNMYHNGGLYGLRWRTNHTRSIYPYFFGAPGEDTLDPTIKPVGFLSRLPRTFGHPFKPMGMYYDQGSYVPIYDLDPIVPGPGPWPWPFFQKLTAVGG